MSEDDVEIKLSWVLDSISAPRLPLVTKSILHGPSVHLEERMK